MTSVRRHKWTLIVLALLPAVVWFYALVLAARPGPDFPVNLSLGQFDLTAALLFGAWAFALGRVWGR